MYSPETDPKYQHDGVPTPDDITDSDVIISSDARREERVPPGQYRTKKWPVLHAMDVPDVHLERWKLEVSGLVAKPLAFSWPEFQELPTAKVFSDFHCVTTWSRLGNLWEGVLTSELLARCGPTPDAKYVIITGYDWGWTTNIPLDEFASADCLFATHHDGKPLDADHGGPVRLVVPKLYAWKSAKWVRRIEFLAEDKPGYWEQLGYHDHGDPWTEERFR